MFTIAGPVIVYGVSASVVYGLIYWITTLTSIFPMQGFLNALQEAFVLEKDGRIIGNIMYTRAWLEDGKGGRKEILSFGPLCVAPEFQRHKLGKILIEHSFDAARKMGYDVNINFGNPGNYVSRGFVSCKKKNVSFVIPGNFPTALLVAELVPGALEGKAWMYIPSTAADCCEDTAAVEAFDAAFPPKEKSGCPARRSSISTDIPL